MKNTNHTLLALAFLALAAPVPETRAQSIYTPYAFTNFTGLPDGPDSVDGLGPAARFNYPDGVAVDSAGNVYVADSSNHTIRRVTAAGVVTTLAGSAGLHGSADGAGSMARFDYPDGVAVDSTGNVYVADSNNHTIRRITAAGVVTTLAGSAGQIGSVDGTGSAARFNYPESVAVDSAGNVYVADSSNGTIRKITPAGEVTTLAGSAGQRGSADGLGSAAQFNAPLGVAVDGAGNIYVADYGNQTIRKITSAGMVTTLAGLAQNRGSTDGAGGAARFSGPEGVAVDGAGNIYVAENGNNTIRKITPVAMNWMVTTLAGSAAGQSGSADGTGGAARFSGPWGVAVDLAGNVWVADARNRAIRKITSAGEVTTLAGAAPQPGSADGDGSAARFYNPSSAAVDSVGNVYVADTRNSTIRKITPAGVVATLAGSAGQYGSADGTGSAARFNFPYGVAVDSAGNVYVADTSNYTIRKITPAGEVTTLAGSVGQSGSADGTGSAARFYVPRGLAVDSASNVYVADTYNHTIRKITPAGVVTTLAGLAGFTGSTNGTGSVARFYYPYGVAADGAGNVYVADTSNDTIRKITAAGEVLTLAGLAGQYGSVDGSGSAARFHSPIGVTVDSAGNVYVADYGNSTIRKIMPTGVVCTLAGLAGFVGTADGTGGVARFAGPWGVAVDGAGNLYVADSNNDRITKGTPLLQFVTSDRSLTVLFGFFHARLIGPFGSNAVLEESANFQAWTPIQTNALPPGGLDITLPVVPNQHQFFRARLVP